MQTKICSICQEQKAITEFNKDTRNKDGFKYYCKACRKIKFSSSKYKIEASKPTIDFKLKRKIKTIKINRRKDKTTSGYDVLCCICISERLPTSRYCIRCLIWQTVRKYSLDQNSSEVLITQLIDKFYKNEASCFYTDLPLVLGLNASIDHRLPKSKGGTNTIDNLEWVHVSINNLKSGRTEKEFIEVYGSILVEYNLLASKGVL